MLERLLDTLNVPTRELQLISPYLVPTRAGERAIAELACEGGVKVSILTNALESTDVPFVHAGYAKRRRKMLEAGVVLYELMRVARVRSRRDRRLTGSSGSSLHAKTFSVDRSRVFVGSFNLDPRSASLNTEMGFVIESPVAGRTDRGRVCRRHSGAQLSRALERGGRLGVARTARERRHRPQDGAGRDVVEAVRREAAGAAADRVAAVGLRPTETGRTERAPGRPRSVLGRGRQA